MQSGEFNFELKHDYKYIILSVSSVKKTLKALINHQRSENKGNIEYSAERVQEEKNKMLELMKANNRLTELEEMDLNQLVMETSKKVPIVKLPDREYDY